MILSRASIYRAGRVSQALPKSTRGTLSRGSWKRVERRGYAAASEEGGHSTHKASSDLPWAVASLVVTVPSLWYLIQPQLQPKKSHGHGHDHEEDEHHEETSEEGAESDAPHDEEAKAAEDGTGGEDAEEGDSKDAKSGESGEEDASAGSYEKESGEDTDGVRFKGPTAGGGQGDTRKHIPDAKGSNKLRIESHYGNKQGEASEPEQDPDDKDLAASSKPTGKAGNASTQSAKQEGLSNTDTKHSIDIVNDSGHSLKGEGMPETAKSKGTVDPFRPQK